MDGTNTYYSNGNSQYILKENNTWELAKEFIFRESDGSLGKVEVDGSSFWSDGTNFYYSNGSEQYVYVKK